MLIYYISNLHISRMELHTNVFVKPCFSPLIAFVPWKYANCILDMSIPHSDNTSLILSVILSLWILWMRLIVISENQEKMTLNFCQNNLFRSFLSLQPRSLHLQIKQYPEHDKSFCLQVLWRSYSAIKERSSSYLKIDKSHFFACI